MGPAVSESVGLSTRAPTAPLNRTPLTYFARFVVVDRERSSRANDLTQRNPYLSAQPRRRHGPPLKKPNPAAFSFMNAASHRDKLAEPTESGNAYYPQCHTKP